MESKTHRRPIDKLMAEAEQATDPHGNGLLDRGDMCGLVARLLASIRVLLAENAALKADQDELAGRLSRVLNHDPSPNHVSQHGWLH